MEFQELIRKRHSVRSYDSSKPVPKEVLEKILDAGRLAPSAANKQPWRFAVITSPEVLQKIHRAYERPWFHNAPCVLVLIGVKPEAWVRSIDGYCSVETDAAIAMTHILLAAANEGVGSCWISNFNPGIVRSALELNENEIPYALTPLGYPEPTWEPKTAKERKSLEEIVRWL